MNHLSYITVSNTISRPSSLVARSIRSALNQRIKPKKCILIDQNQHPTSLTAEIEDNPLFERLKVNAKSVSAARNHLAVPENTEWIVFCDDDGFLDNDYSEQLLRLTQEFPKIDIFAGTILREDTHDYYSLRHKVGGDLKHFINTKLLMGSNFAVKTRIFNELGRFDEDFGAGAKWGSGEETDFCWKAFFAKVPMMYTQDLKVIHVPPFRDLGFSHLNKTLRYALGKGALVCKWLVYRKKPLILIEVIEMTFAPLAIGLKYILSGEFASGLLQFLVIPTRWIGFFRYWVSGMSNSDISRDL